MAIDVLKQFIPGIKEHGIVTDATVTLSGTVTIPATTIIGSVPNVLSASEITTVSDSAVYTVGSRAKDSAGNEYVFCLGVASVVAGDWVVFNKDYAVTRLAGSEVGSVAVAMAAVVASKWGWFQIWGEGSAKVVATGGVRVYTHTVTGQALDTVVTGALIQGAVTTAGTGNTVTGTLQAVQLDYPFVSRASGNY